MARFQEQTRKPFLFVPWTEFGRKGRRSEDMAAGGPASLCRAFL